MPFFVLEPVLPLARKWEHYRKTRKLIVRAPDESSARQVAAGQAEVAGREGMHLLLPEADEGEAMANPWLDAESASCVEMDPDGPPEVVSMQAD
ncbi:hypothetical protein N825_15835 [Skermanella stibiiresistens SB22]|uniref:Uncharacterized protein n=1 Tax=Skermanella stibiiresistens SB22 TaxID=1385369 RepID=W9GZ34_9PROT|nr:hypothetical protein [Skermanella stibiiresistens]EWY37871.1 hypothetical protein N825_15835 [Skermanella stibiiresistens SB22]